MKPIIILFILSMFILIYTYVGYAAILGLLVKLKGKRKIQNIDQAEDLPDVALVIAAYNEQNYILQKIDNCLELDYPKKKLHLYFVTDGSNDLTPGLAALFPNLNIYHDSKRGGKLAAVDRVMKDVIQPITIFSDANAMLNPEAIRNMVRHFQNNRVGAVAGEKSVIQDADATSAGEGLYWKYESLLKKWDYQLHSVVGAAGELFAVRTHLYHKPAADSLIEDFVMTMEIAKDGYIVAYEPHAKATETASTELSEELKRKVRISAGGLQSVWRLRGLLNPFKYGMLTFQYVSHRALRWTLAPVALVVAFVTNMILFGNGYWIFDGLFLAQAAFYGASILGFYLEKHHVRVKGLFVPLYFSFMNLSVFLGALRLMNGNQTVVWDKAKRK